MKTEIQNNKLKCSTCKLELEECWCDTDECDDDEIENDEPDYWYCPGCNWSSKKRPAGGECPRCTAQTEESYY